ncbi:hypothetical protein AUC47_06010 [Microbacterium sp. SZ1]|uniref:hypothetical protein n=1 Tax=Microbacterium sp. SZ1 TaxID=1849736 RepID=UPI000BBBE7A0|nr:hypothetical protein [Microbacterium sp. SZ1]PCE14186.1 hypothetical protein AUC47_06010 [Microbacterium sp. SZ1]
MDVFERVREVNTGVSLTDERIAGARARLLEGIDSGMVTARKRVSRRPMFLIAGAVVGVAAATATVVVVGLLTAPDARVEAIPAPSPTAESTRQPGEVLPHPAPTGGTGITEPFPGTTPQAGQYLSIETTDDRIMYRGAGDSWFYEWSYRPDGAAPITAAIYRNVNTLFVPGDRSGEWVGRSGPANDRIASFPADQSGDWEAMLPFSGDVQTWTYPGGIGGETLPLTGSEEWYLQYPQDPQALLQWFRDRASEGMADPAAVDEVALSNVIDVLVENYAPAPTRATFIEALAVSGHAEITSTDGDIVTYRCRFTEMSDPSTVTVSVDRTTGWVVEYTSRHDRTDADSLADPAPTATPDIRKTITTRIVDALP